MAMSVEQRSNIAALQRQLRRLNISEKFSSGTSKSSEDLINGKHVRGVFSVYSFSHVASFIWPKYFGKGKNSIQSINHSIFPILPYSTSLFEVGQAKLSSTIKPFKAPRNPQNTGKINYVQIICDENLKQKVY